MFSLTFKSIARFFSQLENQRHLQAVKNSFLMIIPIIMTGSFVVLLNSFPLPIYQDLMSRVFGENWTRLGSVIWTGTFSILSLFMVISLSYQLTKENLQLRAISIFTALASFMVLINADMRDATHIGLQGMFIAIIITILSTELFLKLSKFNFLIIKTPEGEVSELTRLSFGYIIPAFLTISTFATGKVLLEQVGINDIFTFFFAHINTYTSQLGGGVITTIALVFFNQLSWFFGIHGSSIINLGSENIVSALNANMEAYAANLAPTFINTAPFFDSFVFIGGSGSTLSMAIAMIVFGKRKYTKQLGLFALVMGLFNINEILILGLPIVLNPIFLIPFLLVPILFSVITYFSMAIGIVPLTISSVHWTTPIFISGYLATDSFAGSLLQLLLLIIGIALYTPFIRFYEEKREVFSNSAVNHSEKIISGDFTEQIDQSYLNRKDELGAIANALDHTQNLFVNIIQRLKGNITNLSTQSENLSTLSENLYTSIGEINNSIESSSSHAADQARDLKDITKVMTEFNVEIDVMNGAAKNVSDSIGEIHASTEQSNENMENMAISIKTVNSSFDVLDSKIIVMNENIKKIASITSDISTIARRTNILAINASIEASSSGEAGKGFAVIAQQIRDLAISSDTSLKDIETIIKHITGDAKEIIEATQTMRCDIDSQYEDSQLTIDSFKVVMSQIISINEKLNQMIEITDTITTQKEEIISSLHHSSDMANDISSANEQIQLSSSGMLDSIQKFVNSSNQLEYMSNDMETEIDKYSV